MRLIKTLFALSLVTLTVLSSGCSNKIKNNKKVYTAYSNTYYAEDDLGRKIAMPGKKGVPKYNENKYVGIFYFLWHGEGDIGDLYDISKIMAEDSEAPYKWEKWGGVGVMHWWGEPLFGYYVATDDWVKRKHIQMLTDADVDFLVFDTTNNSAYEKNALSLMRMLDEYGKQGWDVPKVAFYTNTKTGERMNQIYRNIYKKYPELENVWFKLEGKPLIIGRPSDTATKQEVKDFFTIKHSQWPNEGSLKDIQYFEDGFPWMAFERPQHVYGKSLDTSIISVSIAQHQSTIKFSDTAFYGDDTNWTRSYHNGKNDKSEGAYLHGYNFQEQWDYAISQNPDIVFVTGWNEWIAGNWGNKKSEEPLVFVDCCDINTSRDSEPMRGGYGDNYYMQLINNIRRFKGAKPAYKDILPVTIDIQADFSQWENVKAEYLDYADDTLPRDSKGYGNIIYKNDTGRNDIIKTKVASDENNIYFYIETKNDLSHPSDYHWMNLFINTGKSDKNWYGYDYVINRTNPDWDVVLEKSTGGWNWETVTKCSFKYEGNKMQMSVPLSQLGYKAGDKINIQFKIADNYQGEGDIWSFYIDGDTAPYGRVNYVYSQE